MSPYDLLDPCTSEDDDDDEVGTKWENVLPMKRSRNMIMQKEKSGNSPDSLQSLAWV